MKLLEEINERGTTVVVVTHNLDIVKAMKKRVITMRKGVVTAMKIQVAQMRFSTFLYSVKQGMKNIGRNKMFSLASIATMAACIFLFGIFFSVVTNFKTMVKTAEEGVAVTVFFEKGIEQDKIDEIGKEIKKRPEVAKYDFVSADEAWKDFQKEYFKGNKEAAEGFE